MYDYNNYHNMMHRTRIVRIGTSYGVVIPRAMLGAASLVRGDEIYFSLTQDNRIIINKDMQAQNI